MQAARAQPGAPGGARLRAAGLALLLAVAALLPSLGTLHAGLASDDAAALAWAARAGPPYDWGTSQYGLRTVRFWRPLVTTSLGLQEQVSGVAPGPLRAFNLVCHALTASLVAALARRLGAGALGALVAGLLAAWFPHQGGTAVWVVGRVDSLTAPLLLASACLALDGRAVRAALLALLAYASKESAFVLPAWVALFAVGRGESVRCALRRALPLALVAAAALAWRARAIGALVGGYPVGAGGALEPLALARGFALALAAPLAVALAAAPLALLAGCLRARAFAAAGAAALVAALPLYHAFAPGAVEAEHLRTTLLCDVGLCLALGASCGPARAKSTAASAWLLAAVLFALAGARLVEARRDCRAWAAAGDLAEHLVADTRARIAALPPSDLPVLRDFPRTQDGAYVLQWGVADRFRAPFPASPRPVWPLRLLFEPGQHRRASAVPLEDGLLFPRAGALPELVVACDEERRVGRLVVDERVLVEPGAADGTAVLEVEGVPADATLELVLYTELGYQPGGLEGVSVVAGRARVTLREALLAHEAFALWHALVQAADLGAPEAWLELRALGPDGALVAASRWIRVALEAEILDRVLP